MSAGNGTMKKPQHTPAPSWERIGGRWWLRTQNGLGPVLLDPEAVTCLLTNVNGNANVGLGDGSVLITVHTVDELEAAMRRRPALRAWLGWWRR